MFSTRNSDRNNNDNAQDNNNNNNSSQTPDDYHQPARQFTKSKDGRPLLSEIRLSESSDLIIDYLSIINEQAKKNNKPIFNKPDMNGIMIQGRLFIGVGLESAVNETKQEISARVEKLVVLEKQIKDLFFANALHLNPILSYFDELYNSWKPSLDPKGLEDFKERFFNSFMGCIESNNRWKELWETMTDGLGDKETAKLRLQIAGALSFLIESCWSEASTVRLHSNARGGEKKINLWGKLNNSSDDLQAVRNSEKNNLITQVIEHQFSSDEQYQNEKQLGIFVLQFFRRNTPVDKKKNAKELLEIINRMKQTHYFLIFHHETGYSEAYDLLLNNYLIKLFDRINGILDSKKDGVPTKTTLSDKNKNTLTKSFAKAILTDIHHSYGADAEDYPEFIKKAVGQIKDILASKFDKTTFDKINDAAKKAAKKLAKTEAAQPHLENVKKYQNPLDKDDAKKVRAKLTGEPVTIVDTSSQSSTAKVKYQLQSMERVDNTKTKSGNKNNNNNNPPPSLSRNNSASHMGSENEKKHLLTRDRSMSLADASVTSSEATTFPATKDKSKSGEGKPKTMARLGFRSDKNN